jgi:asparagine synthase (glutamine-hydrolysing)
LPDEYLIKGWNKKYLLKQTFKSYFPDRFLEKSKQGFAIPVGDWLRTILKSELQDFVNLKFIKEQNIFNENYIIPLVNNHLTSKEDNTFRVWSFYCFQKWYKKTYLSL